jgi:Phage integrase, N-terminal SAM-like domain.
VAELIFTTESFKPNGTPLTGVPMLLDSEMRLIEPVCAWLMNIAMIRGRTRSSETWRTYGEALYDWWQTLEANQWVWDQITPIQAAAYRDRMLHKPSEQTGQPLAPTTINGRVRIIAMFYRWCYARGLVKKGAIRRRRSHGGAPSSRRHVGPCRRHIWLSSC